MGTPTGVGALVLWASFQGPGGPAALSLSWQAVLLAGRRDILHGCWGHRTSKSAGAGDPDVATDQNARPRILVSGRACWEHVRS